MWVYWAYSCTPSNHFVRTHTSPLCNKNFQHLLAIDVLWSKKYSVCSRWIADISVGRKRAFLSDIRILAGLLPISLSLDTEVTKKSSTVSIVNLKNKSRESMSKTSISYQIALGALPGNHSQGSRSLKIYVHNCDDNYKLWNRWYEDDYWWEFVHELRCFHRSSVISTPWTK